MASDLDLEQERLKARDVHAAIMRFADELNQLGNTQSITVKQYFGTYLPPGELDRMDPNSAFFNDMAVWERGASSFSGKEKLGLIIIEFLKLAGCVDILYYDHIRGSIIYNNGNCRITVLPSEGSTFPSNTGNYVYQSHMEAAAKNELLFSPDDAFDDVLDYYKEIFPEQGAFTVEQFMRKGADWFQPSDIATSDIFVARPEWFSLSLGDFKDGTPLYFDSDESLFTIAPPGAGKTQCHVLPNLITYCGPVIALDVKGDCYEATHAVREKLGTVHRFSPFDVEKSAHYNPLDFVSDNPLRVWEDSQKLAKLIVVTDKPTHWDNRATELLTAIIAHVKLNDAEKNMTKVCDWTYASTDQFHDLIFELTESDVNGMRRTGNAMFSTLKNSPKMFESNLESLRGYLGAWQGDNISAITNRSDWSPTDFMVGKNSPSLFLIIPPSEIKTYAAVLRVLVGQHLDHFFRDHSKPAKWPVLVMLDEMPQLGYMEQIPKAQDTGRSYNVRLWMFAQYVGQLQKAYGKEIADGMIAAAGVRMYMNPSDDNAANLSEILGEVENVITGVKEPLASPMQLTGREFRSDIIVKAKGEAPVRLKKVFFGDMNLEIFASYVEAWALTNVTLDERASLADAVEVGAEVEHEEAPSLSLT